jgi:hypothetical protein
MNKKMYKNLLAGGVVASLSLLPGCAILDAIRGDKQQGVTENVPPMAENQKPMTGQVLVTMKGMPVITTDTLAAEKDKLLKANPQIQQAVAMMESRGESLLFDRNLLDGLVGQKIADEYVTSQRINQTAAYKAELRDLCDSMEHMLNSKYFTEKMNVALSDAEVKAFYDNSKDKIQGLMISQGGVACAGIEFADANAAHVFVSKAKATPGGFKKAAQDEGLNAKIKDFKLVNDQSIGMDELLRDKIIGVKSVPAIEEFNVNGKFWVVNLTTKEEPKYLAFEQVKAPLKQQMEQQKRAEMVEKEINRLKGEYAVEVNENYFKMAQASQVPAAAPVQHSAVADATQQKDAAEKHLA